eukprot:TRINITY_DN13344_c0_g1_i1.p1 TRINITY_DN13344_c0_g1~~TRINITY_DN13344_c0_g1_i1.p1  ORF type:complete len:1557 (-),score=486.75 TRINITY_DN13344_c0_g1_i1:181-4851(-)
MSEKPKQKDKDKKRRGEEQLHDAKRSRHEEEKDREKEKARADNKHQKDSDKEKQKDQVRPDEKSKKDKEKTDHGKGNDKDKVRTDEKAKKDKEKGKEKTEKDKDKKDKKEKDKVKKEKKEGKERVKKEAAQGKAAASTGAEKRDLKQAEAAPSEAAVQTVKPEEPPEKKLKAWQDDELEVESGDEGKVQTNLQTLSAVAARSMGGQASQVPPAAKQLDALDSAEAAEAAQADTLDAFMADLATKDVSSTTVSNAPAALGEGLGVMDSSRVKSITMEEVEALMGVAAPVAGGGQSTEAASSSGQGGAASSEKGVSSATVAVEVVDDEEEDQKAKVNSVPEADDDDDSFHAAFLAEIRRQRGESMPEQASADQPAFLPAATWEGPKKGYFLSTRRGKTGYYLDTLQRLPAPKGEDVAKDTPPSAPRPPARVRFPSLVLTAEEDAEVLGLVPKGFPPDAVFVRSVDPGSWCQENGVLPGDELVMVNGEDVLKMTKNVLLRMMRTRPVCLAFARPVIPPADAFAAPASVGKEAARAKAEEEKARKAEEAKLLESDDEEDEQEEEEDPKPKPEAGVAGATEGPSDPTSDNKPTVANDSTASASSCGNPLDVAAASQGVGGAEGLPHSVVPQAKRVLTKKEKRQLRREAREKEAKEKAEVAKKQFGGEGKDELMESDPDQSEASTEEEPQSYFDLVKRFTTKKTLPEVDHSKIEYQPFRKNLYIQVKEITNMKDHEVEDLRRVHGNIKLRGKNFPRPIKSFLQCGLPERIVKILDRRDYELPFPVQMQAIPALMIGRDVIAVAQTGSGKTLAYLLPMIRHVLDQPPLSGDDGPPGFIIAPTRELALQIQREAAVFCKAVGLNSVCAYGGGPMGEQLSALKKGAHILVGTPGRLIDVLTTSNGKITNLRRVTFLVLDEADRMFDMGFEPQIGMFLQSSRPDKQVAMFSATLPLHVEALARSVLKKPLEICVGERNTAATNVKQFVEVLDESKKFYRLLQLLGEWHEHGSIIIFLHQQKDVDEMFTELLKYGYPSLSLHGGQDQHDRDFTLQDFKDNVANILIATSVAARGIDVKQVILVINFKVPEHLEDYIHRIGRTGRAGKAGFAYTFIQPDEGEHAQDMMDALRQCGQEVPLKLRKLVEDHQALVNTGQAKKKKRWGGFGGRSFKYDNTELSQQMKDRSKAKNELLIGEHVEDQEEEEFKDPWDEDGVMTKKPKKDEKTEEPPKITGSDPASTAALAAQTAARLQAETEAKQASKAVAAIPSIFPAADLKVVAVPPAKAAAAASSASAEKASSGGAEVAKAKPQVVIQPASVLNKRKRKSEKEIEEQAQKMAEGALASLPEEIREERLPALKEKLKQKLEKQEQELDSTPASSPPPPPPKALALTPLEKALPVVPGIINLPAGVARVPEMVSKSIDQLKANIAAPKVSPTAADAEERANHLLGNTSASAMGQVVDEFPINDYPQIARQKISHREPLLQIEEMTGARCWVKGQFFSDERKMPEGAKKLYVEITGPTQIAVQRAKKEVQRMMEALAIRTLNIPGIGRNQLGTPGRYDPAVGK